MIQHLPMQLRRRRLLRGTLAAALAAGACALALGAGPATQPNAPAPVFDAKPLLLDQARRIEDQTATLMERRPETPVAQRPVLDLQIDLNILADSLLNRCASAGADGDFAACASLRARELSATADQVSKSLTNATLDPAQLDAMGKLHQLSYAPAPAGSAAQLDDFSRSIGLLLLKTFGPLPPGLNGLPMMRPAAAESTESAASRPPRTLAELTAAAQRAAVSPALRQQLLTLARATANAAADPARQDEANTLYRGLSQAMDVAESFQQGGLIGPDALESTESHLSDAIVLYMDPRTHRVGHARIDRLAAYRRLLGRVSAMHLSKNLRAQLVPAFTWSREHSEAGAQVMDTIESYARLCAAHDQVERPKLAGSSMRVLDLLDRQFARERRQFSADAADLPNNEDDPSDAADQLQDDLAQLARTSDSIDLITQLPAEIKALAPYKPRPSGGLERRATIAIAALGGSGNGRGPEMARQYLASIRTMAQAARRLASEAVPAAVDQLYARGTLAQFNRVRATLLTALASQAAGREIDNAELARLESAGKLADAIQQAAKVQYTLDQQAVLGRWVDWDISQDAVAAVLQPYRDATADAIEGICRRDLQPMEAWETERTRAAPLLELLANAGKYVGPCNALPGGWPGDVAKLLTPMDGQPFALERFASLALGRIAPSDADGAGEVLDAVAARAAEKPASGG